MINSYIADPHQKKLLKKWAPILESGKKIQSESTKVALAQVLENTRNFYKMHNMLNEAGIPYGGPIGENPAVDREGKASVSSRETLLFRIAATAPASTATTTFLRW